MADQDAVDRSRFDADQREPAEDFGPREPGIDEKPRAAGLDIDCITFASTCKQADLQWFLR